MRLGTTVLSILIAVRNVSYVYGRTVRAGPYTIEMVKMVPVTVNTFVNT